MSRYKSSERKHTHAFVFISNNPLVKVKRVQSWTTRLLFGDWLIFKSTQNFLGHIWTKNQVPHTMAEAGSSATGRGAEDEDDDYLNGTTP